MFHGEFFNYQISTETYCRQRERSQQRYIKDPQNSWKYWKALYHEITPKLAKQFY